MIKGNAILLIGGTRYVGNVIAEHLLRDNYTVKTLGLLLYKNGIWNNSYINNQNYKFIYGDMCDNNILLKALVDVDSVILLAGLVGDPITKKYPEESAYINNLSSIIKKKNLLDDNFT